jgi:hypothetical protein
MALQYSIEPYYERFHFIGEDNKNSFIVKLELAEKKLQSERFVLKLKKNIERIYTHHLKMIAVLPLLHSQYPEINGRHLEHYPIYRRFTLIPSELHLLLIPKQEKDKTTIELFYEKYNERVGFWENTKIMSFSPTKDIQKRIESAVELEFKIFNIQDKLKKFIETKMDGLTEHKSDSHYIKDSDTTSHSRVLCRFTFENKKLTCLLHCLEGRHKIIFGFDEIHPGFRNVMRFKEWFSVSFINFFKSFEKELANIQQQKIKEIKKISWLEQLKVNLNK